MFSIPHESDVMVDRGPQLQLQALPVDGWKHRQDHVEQICTAMKKIGTGKIRPILRLLQIENTLRKHEKTFQSYCFFFLSLN